MFSIWTVGRSSSGQALMSGKKTAVFQFCVSWFWAHRAVCSCWLKSVTSLKASVERGRNLRSLLSLKWSLASDVACIQHALWDVLLYTWSQIFHGKGMIAWHTAHEHMQHGRLCMCMSGSFSLSCSPLCAGSISGAGCSFITASQRPWSVTWHHVSASSHYTNTDTHARVMHSNTAGPSGE